MGYRDIGFSTVNTIGDSLLNQDLCHKQEIQKDFRASFLIPHSSKVTSIIYSMYYVTFTIFYVTFTIFYVTFTIFWIILSQ